MFFDQPIWHNPREPDWLVEALRGQTNVHKSGPEWSFWRDWYQGFLVGKPLDWGLQKEIALIPDEEWDKGPENIAALIEEIGARFELRNRIGAIESELATATQTRHGIGGNNPPESIEDAPAIAKEFIFVWEPLQNLKEELEAKSPDKARIQGSIDALILALKKGLEWCASKADLAVDSAIKWAIPTVGGYLALNPDKLEAVIEAAKTWISVLP